MKIKIKNKLSIMQKLLIGFSIPTLLVALLGSISYMIVTVGLKQNYEIMIKKNLSISAEYLNYGFESIDALAVQLSVDKELVQCMNTPSSSLTLDKFNYIKNKENEFIAKSSTEHFVNNIYMISNNGELVIASQMQTDLVLNHEYKKDFPELNEVEYIIWDSHPRIDRAFSLDSNSYVYTYARKIGLGNYLIIDIDRNAIATVLKQIDPGVGSYTGVINKRGTNLNIKHEINSDDKTITMDEGSEALSDIVMPLVREESELCEYINWNNTKYLYSSVNIGNTGICLYTLIPYDIIMEEAYDIRNATIAITITALIISIIVGIIFSNGIAKALHRTNNCLKKIERGEFNSPINLKRNDEFLSLENSINKMMKNVSILIKKSFRVSNLVNNSSVKVKENLQKIYGSTQIIYHAIQDIASGATTQASDCQECLVKIENLTYIIDEVNLDIHDIADKNMYTVSSIKMV